MKSDQRKDIEELVQILTEQNLTEIEIQRKDFRIRVRRESPPHLAIPSSSASSLSSQGAGSYVTMESAGVEGAETSRYVTVTSPIVGTFYRSPSQDADPYVEEGDIVKKGQILCLVEAMKLMNEIESESNGRIVKVLGKNNTPVEYGQPLFLIQPLPGS